MTKNLLSLFRSENDMYFDALGSTHAIDGVSMTIVVDNEALKRREDKNAIHLGEQLYFARADDFDRLPSVGSVQIFDDRDMTVEDVSEDCGIVRIVLSQNTGDTRW